VVIATLLLCPAACKRHRSDSIAVAPSTVASAPAPTAARDPVAEPTQCNDSERIPVFVDGAVADRVCPADVAKRELTVLDLSDGWLSSLFDEDLGMQGGKLDYRAELSSLQNEALDSLPQGHRAKSDRYLELYGISPTFSVLRARLLDKARHECHDKIAREPLLAVEEPLDAWRKVDAQRGDRFAVVDLEQRLAHGRDTLGKRDISELRDDKRYGISYKLLTILKPRVAAIATAQAHLRCEGLLKEAEESVFDTRTLNAFQLYLKKHAVVTWTLDRESATVMATDSRILDLRALLRSLRERVVDATDVIEDGTALGATGLVAGQDLDSSAFDHLFGRDPLPDGAPDRVAEATDAAARALGWQTAKDAIAFFEKHAELPPNVAVKLPPRPGYHHKHMELRAVIDRGDVWYDYPYAGSGGRALPSAQRRPVLVLYAKDGDKEIPLIRWGTTIGDWKPERVGRTVRMLYKESPVGPRLWRDLVVTPRWIPPESTPTRDLVVPVIGGYRVKRELVGPSYASAYGLVMLVHHAKNGDNWADQGIRTHGSVSYDSIHQGSSHGCHRLHNHRAVRLAQFLLAHRNHVRKGAEPFPFGRTFAIAGKRVQLDFDSRGYRYELTPPVAIEVQPGRILGKARRALPTAFTLPADLARKFMAEMQE
jgi:hypothetical protein